jgi:hypothetical protein
LNHPTTLYLVREDQYPNPEDTMSTMSRINRLERRVLQKEDRQRFVILPSKARNNEEWVKAVDRYFGRFDGTDVSPEVRQEWEEWKALAAKLHCS